MQRLHWNKIIIIISYNYGDLLKYVCVPQKQGL